MKKIILSIITVFILFIAMSCNSNKEASDIYTSCYPIYDLTKRIVGDKKTVSNLVKAGVEPHDYEPSTQDIKNLYDCELFIINGLNLEHYTSNLTNTITKKTFTATTSIELIYSNHSHEEEHDHGDVDPHVWLDPNNAIIMMENIKNKMVELDSENKAYYEDNFNKNKALFIELDREFKTELTNLSSRYLVTSHEAFGYLCKAYGLTQLAISGLSTEDEPTAAAIANLIDQIKGLNVTTIFSEELVSSAIAESIASQTGLICDVLDPIEGLSEDNKTNDYLSLMRKNLTAIKKALA